MNIEVITEKLEKAFKEDNIKKQVLDKDWLAKNIESGIDETGFCFASSEIIYRLTGGKENWLIKSIDKKVWDDGTHYYLESKETGEILDITSNQYTNRGIEIPYNLGKAKGLRNVSNKAKKLASFLDIEL